MLITYFNGVLKYDGKICSHDHLAEITDLPVYYLKELFKGDVLALVMNDDQLRTRVENMKPRKF